ncbi:NCS2 family permease [Proteinivorax hydrogeniformans]|uniref:NCS2 family permease n=1 Tax=Proteinivorax hydrogeniformans TaxID=1826727 RepID=A0AAU8HS59_9FIRM
MLERIFKLKERKTNVSTEIIAGLTTFMTMAYILFVNPDILSDAGMPKEAVLTATALAAALTTILMGFFTNYPFALASGMGLNAFFAYTIAGQSSWEVALGAVFISGVAFAVLAITGIITKIDHAVPTSLKRAVSAGIGLFIAFIGLKNAEIIVSYEPTLLALGDITEPATLLALIGIIITGALMALKVKGALLIGIVVTTLIGFPMGVSGSVENGITAMPTLEGIVFQLDIRGAITGLGFMTIFALIFVDLFDTMGTLMGTGARAGYLDKNGNLPKVKNAMLVDSVGTIFGSMVGTSTVTTYVESTAGVTEGGRTGLTAVVAGLLFLVAIFFSPLALVVPGAATAPALVIVGVLMMGAVKDIDFEDFTEAFPAFLTIIFMPFAFSIAHGISVGFIAYPLVKVFSGKYKEVHWFIYVLALASILHLMIEAGVF